MSEAVPAPVRKGLARPRLTLLVLLLGLLSHDSALAHGGGAPRLVDVPVGPYRLYVWSKPDPVRVGDVHFTIGVFEPPREGAPDEPVLDAAVEVSTALMGAPAESWSGPASRENSTNKLYYEVDIPVPMAGTWRAEVAVAGAAGSGTAAFEFEVLAPAVNWTLIGGGGAVLLAAGWWIWNSRPRKGVT